MVTHLSYSRMKLIELLASLEQHVKSGRSVLLYSGSKPLSAHQLNRCKVVHTPLGIEASVPESMVQERYEKIGGTYNRIRSMLASDRNEYSPIYRLHDHLMVEIWSYLCVLGRHYVTQVSRRFRSIALNTAYLWTFINLSHPPSVPPITTLLKRAGTAPLHICLKDHSCGIPWEPPWDSFGLLSTRPQPLPSPLPPPPDVIASIPRAAVFDATLVRERPPQLGSPFQWQREPGLKFEDLNMPMPLLRSLRLSMSPAYLHHTQLASTRLLFDGHTPLLRHVALIQCEFNWSDCNFRNLTYLLIRKPVIPFGISHLVQVLLSSPSLTYLGLEDAIAPTDPSTMPSNVGLPALQRLYITDKDTQRISATLRYISAPNVLECDFTSSDTAWFDPTIGVSPFSHLNATQDVTLIVTEHNGYRWIIECGWGAKHAVRFHSGSTATGFHFSPHPTYEDETVKLIDMLRGSSILFEHVQSLTLRGDFGVKNLKQVLALFPTIKGLSTRHLCHGACDGSTILGILSIEHCPQLQTIDIGGSPELSPLSLIAWLSDRPNVSKVIVTSERPLPSEERSVIVSMLDKFLWLKPPASKLPYNPQAYHPSGITSVFPGSFPSPITEVTATELIEDASWDEDDEEWTRVSLLSDSIHPFPPNTNRSVLDDPTLVYCNRGLQGRWDYFGVPGA